MITGCQAFPFDKINRPVAGMSISVLHYPIGSKENEFFQDLLSEERIQKAEPNKPGFAFMPVWIISRSASLSSLNSSDGIFFQKRLGRSYPYNSAGTEAK